MLVSVWKIVFFFFFGDWYSVRRLCFAFYWMDFCGNLKVNFFYVSSKLCVFIEILFFSLKIILCFLLDGLSLIFKFQDYPLTFPLSTMQLVLRTLLQYRHIFCDLRKNV